ncbi:hypothetical protein BGZ79_005053, partial [Entomortierella chlamydospora]
NMKQESSHLQPDSLLPRRTLPSSQGLFPDRAPFHQAKRPEQFDFKLLGSVPKWALPHSTQEMAQARAEMERGSSDHQLASPSWKNSFCPCKDSVERNSRKPPTGLAPSWKHPVLPSKDGRMEQIQQATSRPRSPRKRPFHPIKDGLFEHIEGWSENSGHRPALLPSEAPLSSKQGRKGGMKALQATNRPRSLGSTSSVDART